MCRGGVKIAFAVFTAVWIRIASASPNEDLCARLLRLEKGLDVVSHLASFATYPWLAPKEFTANGFRGALLRQNGADNLLGLASLEELVRLVRERADLNHSKEPAEDSKPSLYGHQVRLVLFYLRFHTLSHTDSIYTLARRFFVQELEDSFPYRIDLATGPLLAYGFSALEKKTAVESPFKALLGELLSETGKIATLTFTDSWLIRNMN